MSGYNGPVLVLFAFLAVAVLTIGFANGGIWLVTGIPVGLACLWAGVTA